MFELHRISHLNEFEWKVLFFVLSLMNHSELNWEIEIENIYTQNLLSVTICVINSKFASSRTSENCHENSFFDEQREFNALFEFELNENCVDCKQLCDG